MIGGAAASLRAAQRGSVGDGELMIVGILGCYSLVHEAGPGRSTRCLRAREFHDHRPILMLQDEKPCLVKFSRTGPSRIVLRNISPMWALLSSQACLPNFGSNYTTVIRPAASPYLAQSRYLVGSWCESATRLGQVCHPPSELEHR